MSADYEDEDGHLSDQLPDDRDRDIVFDSDEPCLTIFRVNSQSDACARCGGPAVAPMIDVLEILDSESDIIRVEGERGQRIAAQLKLDRGHGVGTCQQCQLNVIVTTSALEDPASP